MGCLCNKMYNLLTDHLIFSLNRSEGLCSKKLLSPYIYTEHNPYKNIEHKENVKRGHLSFIFNLIYTKFVGV